MSWVLQRRPGNGETLPGSLVIDGALCGQTIENQAHAIPAGTYPVTFTPSDRAHQGKLWTPDPDFQLPLLWNVHGRAGIRIHAANAWNELDGCIAVGAAVHGWMLLDSRFLLTLVMYRIAMTPNHTIQLVVLDPQQSTPPPQAA